MRSSSWLRLKVAKKTLLTDSRNRGLACNRAAILDVLISVSAGFDLRVVFHSPL